MSTLASRMRARREELGLGVRELARLAGGSHADISKIEAGVQLRPGAEKLSRYASALGVSAEWLLHGSDGSDLEERARASEAAREAEHRAAMKEMADTIMAIRQSLSDMRAAKDSFGADRQSLRTYVLMLQDTLSRVPVLETDRGKAIAEMLTAQLAATLAEMDQLAEELRAEPVAKESSAPKT